MKSTLDQLTLKERQALASIYDTDGFKALKKLCEIEIIALGKDALQASTMEIKSILQGKAMMAVHIPKTIQEESKHQNKDS